MMYWTAESHFVPPITVTALSQEELLADLRRRMQRGEGFALATLNLDHAVKLRTNAFYRAAYAAHSHVSADGRPVVWLSRLAGQRVDLITGSDLIDPLMALAAAQACAVAFVGSTASTLVAAADTLSLRYPKLKVAAQIAPPMDFEPEGPAADALIEELGASEARLCLLALGSPKQEIFAARAVEKLPHMGFASIGAGLDFIAGTQRRAPRLLRALALEWLWRLANDPRRLSARYAACFRILPGLVVRAMRERFPVRRGDSA